MTTNTEALKASIRYSVEDLMQTENIDAVSIPMGDKLIIAGERAAIARHLGYHASPEAPAAELRKDAETWGGALNEAAWEFIEACPEKSTLLFNTCKPALRAAILKYFDAIAKRQAATAPVADAAPRQRFETWAKQNATPYDLREHKYIANGVRTYMQDRTQWAFEAFCGALGISAAPAPGAK